MQRDFDLVIYGFLLKAFGTKGAPKIDPDFDGALARLGEVEALQMEVFHRWSLESQVGLAELLKSWLIALAITSKASKKIRVPLAMRFGTNSVRLNAQVVKEILRRASELQIIYYTLEAAFRARLAH